MNLKAAEIEKWYFRGNSGSNRFFSVRKADLLLESGKVLVLTGRSGSGKTTLLNMLSGLLSPSTGKVLCDGRDLYAMTDDELSRFRNRHFGMIPQSAGVLKTLTLMENILLPQTIYQKQVADGAEEYAAGLLEQLGMGNLENAGVDELSGGELRRMSVVRALCARPDVIFADEPTSDLDDENMQIVLGMLRRAADEGAAVLIVTHDSEALAYADLVMRMDAGCLQNC